MALYDDAFAANTSSDDTASMDDMAGPASSVNQSMAAGAAKGTPTRALVMLWFACLLLIWGLGYLFRRQLR